MYSLIFPTLLITAFTATVPDDNYRDECIVNRNKNRNNFLTKRSSYQLYPLRNFCCSVPLFFLTLQVLQTELQNEAKQISQRSSADKTKPFSKKKKSLPKLKPHEIDFVRYHSLDKMYSYLHSLQWKYPHLVKIESLGESFENRNIELIKVSTGEVGTKTTMLIVGGMNSNEWISPATIVYCIQQLVENSVNNYMLGRADWLFIPVTNPDGYEYSYRKNHKWKKTRSHGANATQCVGVNLNKNCDSRCTFKNNSCSDFHAGPKSFSEQEAQALYDLITRGVPIQLYVNINNYGQSLEFPLENAKKFILDSSDLQYLAEKASDAVYKYGGRRYAIKGTRSCGSEQWVRTEGIKYSYNLKVPRGNNPGKKMQVPESNILSIAQEVFVVLRAFEQILVSIYSVTYDLIAED